MNAIKDTPTAELLRKTNSLSVQQMIAYQTAMPVYKILKSGKPTYLARKLTMTTRNLRGNRGNINQGGKSLSITKEGFLYRGKILFNNLEENIRNEQKLDKFKEMLKKWIKEKIPVKPVTKLSHLPTRQHHTQHPPQPPDCSTQQPVPPDLRLTTRPAQQNTIRNYFGPQDLNLPQHGDPLDQHGLPPPQVRDLPEHQYQENNNQRSIRDYFNPT